MPHDIDQVDVGNSVSHRAEVSGLKLIANGTSKNPSLQSNDCGIDCHNSVESFHSLCREQSPWWSMSSLPRWGHVPRILIWKSQGGSLRKVTGLAPLWELNSVVFDIMTQWLFGAYLPE